MLKGFVKKGVAWGILCGALIFTTVSVPVHAQEQQMLTTGFEDNEDFRLFKYRTLKALNKLRDAGVTPQVIANNLFNDQLTDVTQDTETVISNYANDVGQEISDAVQQKTEAVVQDATDAATEAVKKQMNNWVDSLGESIGRALREMIDNILGGNDAE